MTQNNMYHQCCRHYGKTVRITCHDGRTHVGEITRISRDMVWIQPAGNLGGYGYGFGGFGNRGYGGYGGYGNRRYNGFRFGFGIALGAIAGVALASAFFW